MAKFRFLANFRFLTLHIVHSWYRYFSGMSCSYEDQEIALNCGMMLRECCRAQSLAAIVINSPEFYDFFNYVEVSTFDIASDAFSTFKVGLNKVEILHSPK